VKMATKSSKFAEACGSKKAWCKMLLRQCLQKMEWHVSSKWWLLCSFLKMSV
jgi:hypothetical protein